MISTRKPDFVFVPIPLAEAQQAWQAYLRVTNAGKAPTAGQPAGGVVHFIPAEGGCFLVENYQCPSLYFRLKNWGDVRASRLLGRFKELVNERYGAL